MKIAFGGAGHIVLYQNQRKSMAQHAPRKYEERMKARLIFRHFFGSDYTEIPCNQFFYICLINVPKVVLVVEKGKHRN
jgi:hypothetical protein